MHAVKDAYHRETNEDCREQPDHKLEMSTGQLKKYMWGQKIKKNDKKSWKTGEKESFLYKMQL